MKIKDLKAYVSDLIEGKGRLLNLGSNDDALLLELMVKGTDLENYVGSISSFAGNSYTQLFYELLQNANDAKATDFYIWYDQYGFLVINNGDPFIVDGKYHKPGRLRSFLAKNTGAKGNDPDAIGKYGQGSKLLYDLLAPDDKKKDEGLREVIMQRHKGLKLFSWKSLDSLEAFQVWDENTLELVDYKREEIPTLTKTIFTYFPALPGEKYKVGGQEIELFPNAELRAFVEALNAALEAKGVNELKFNQGSAIFLPLGEGKFEKLEKALEGNLMLGLSTSLSILDQVKSLQINEEKIYRTTSFYEAKLVLELEAKEGAVIRTARVYWPKDITSLTEPISNFSQYFPVTDEDHGLKLIIDSDAYTISNSRQTLDFGETNTEKVLKGISANLIDHVYELAEDNQIDKLCALIAATVTADQSKLGILRPMVKQLFYNDLIEALRQNIPVTSGVADIGSVALNNTSLPVSAANLGVEIQWVDRRLHAYAERLKRVIGVSVWNISDLLKAFATEEKRAAWMNGLGKEDNEALLDQVEKLSTHQIIQLPFIKFSDGRVYSMAQVKKSDSLITLDERTATLESILLNAGRSVGGKDIFSHASLSEKLCPSLSGDQQLLERIFNCLDPQTLERDDKWQIFRTLRDHWSLPEEYLKGKVPLFKNRRGECQPLCKLLKPGHSYAPSGILHDFELHPAEVLFDELDGYLMPSDSTWTVITTDLEKVKGRISLKNYSSALTDLQGAYVLSKAKTPLAEHAWLINTEGQFVDEEDIFYNDSIAKFSEVEYDKLNALVTRIADRLYLLPFEALSALSQVSFAEKPNRLLGSLEGKLSQDNAIVSKSDVSLLLKTKSGGERFFTRLKITSENDELQLSAQSGKQYHSKDAQLIQFLHQQDSYFLLPEELYGILGEEPGLEKDYGLGSDNFARSLIESFGSEKALINLVGRSSSHLKVEYLNCIDRFELSSNANVGTYATDSYEDKLLGIALAEKQAEVLKAKTFIDGKPLNQFIYKDEVIVGNWYFSLSTLLRNHSGKTDVIKTIKGKFASDFNAATFFSLEAYPLDNITDKILGQGTIDNPEQVAFLVAYHESDEEGIQVNSRINDLDWEAVDHKQVLTALFKHGLYQFAELIGACFWQPADFIYAPEKSGLLLKKEQPPQWLTEWLEASDKGSAERLAFLKKSGLKTSKFSILELREKVQKGEVIDYRQNSPKYLKDRRFFDHTLEWIAVKLDRGFKREQNSYRAIAYLINEFVKIYDCLPEYLPKFISEGVELYCQLVKRDILKGAYYLGDLNQEDTEILIDALKEIAFLLLDTTALFQKEFQSCLEQNGIKEAKLAKEFAESAQNQLTEWQSAKYRKWQEEYDQYSILISNSEIPFTYSLHHEPAKTEIGTFNKGEAARHELEDGKKDLLVHLKSQDESVLEAVKASKEELFKWDHKALAALLELFSIDDTQHKLLEAINRKGLTLEQINSWNEGHSGRPNISVQNKEESASEVQERETPYGLKDDLSEEQLRKLNNNLTDVNQLLGKVNGEELQQIIRNLDKVRQLMETEDDQSTPSLLIGYIGEVLVLEWLKRRSPNLQIEHSAVKKVNGKIEMTYSEYDLKIQDNGMTFLLDVKTTIKPVRELNRSVAFFITNKQYHHISTNPDDKYFIFRISLQDLGLLDFYHEVKKMGRGEYEEIINQLHGYILNGVKAFLDAPGNEQLLLAKRMVFRVSVPRIEGGIPF